MLGMAGLRVSCVVVIWFANTPGGAGQPGTLSIVDPGGRPLAGAPSRLSGGVFAGDRTARQPEKLVFGGLGAGVVATALLGMSPDGSKRAVFEVPTADGALAQAYTERSVDGLAPPGTIAGLPGIAGEGGTAEQPMALRAGMAFNWAPDRIFYVTDPAHNQIVAFKLMDDGQVFRHAETRILKTPGLDMPVDLAPAVPETANPTLASTSTMAGGSDRYVVSRSSGTVMRLRWDGTGTVLATRKIMADGVFDALSGQGGPVARAHSVAEGSMVCGAVPGIPAAANMTSVRSASALFGLGLIEAMPDAVILELATWPGRQGRVNSVRGPDGRERPGRFGWKADTTSLEQFVADAFRNEMGITSPLAPIDLVSTRLNCTLGTVLKDDGGAIQAITACLSVLRPLPPAPPAMAAGQATFSAVERGGCHRPSVRTWDEIVKA